MGWSKANIWETQHAKDLAREIANTGGIPCGPAVGVWVAAVWNHHKGRTSYDAVARVKAHSDGARYLRGGRINGRISVDEIIRRESNRELRLSTSTDFRYSVIHSKLEKYDNPVIIRQWGPVEGKTSVHYVALYKSYLDRRAWYERDKIKFYWQDNGVYGTLNGGNPGLYKTGYWNYSFSVFPWGAARVVRV